MPSTLVWSGATLDGNFGTAGNWVGGVAPVGGDSVVFNSGSNPVTAGLTTGISIVSMTVTANYGGVFGDSSGNPLTFTAITTLLKYAGTGAYAYFGSSGTVAAASLEHSGGATVYISTGTWTTLTNSTGNVVIAAAAVITTYQNAGGQTTIGYNATAITTLSTAGLVTCKRVITTANIIRSTLIHQDNGTTNYTTIGTCNIYGGIYNKQSGGTDTTVNAFPGSRFTVVGNSGGSTGTVTVSTLNEWAGSMVGDTVPGLTLTITTRTKVGAMASGVFASGVGAAPAA